MASDNGIAFPRASSSDGTVTFPAAAARTMTRHIARRFGRRARVVRIRGDDAETVARAALMV